MYGAPSRTIIDPCTSLVDPRESIRLSGRFSIIESIFENRLSIIGSTSDVLGSIIVHDGAPYQTGRYIAKIAAGGIKATGRGFAKFLAKFIESGSVARKPWSGKQSKRNDRATEWSGPCNGTKRTVERNGTDRFTPFLGKRYRRATQTERTVLRTFFRRVPYVVRGKKSRVKDAECFGSANKTACICTLKFCTKKEM